MGKIYIVFTFHEDNFNGTKTVGTDLFINREDAIKRIDDYSEAQVRLENSRVIDEFGEYCGAYSGVIDEFGEYCGASFVPQSVMNMFWHSGDIIYGKTVRTIFKNEVCFTYRFMIEKETI